LHKKRSISYNYFFIIPFITWVVAGGILVLAFTREQLFFAANRNYSDAGDAIMPYITFFGQGEVIIPGLLLLLLIPRFRNRRYFILAFMCNIVPFVIQQALKSVFNSPRPLLRYHNHFWVHVSPGWPELTAHSFPSGHSEGAFSFFCFLSLLLPPGYRGYGLLFFILALSVCYSRIYLAAHFFEDVYAGSILGTVITTVVFYIMNKYDAVFPQKKVFLF
jgi:membrane-associated phospholipid phosphatase